MSEQGSSSIEGNVGFWSKFKDRVRSTKWAERVAAENECRLKKVGVITEEWGIRPVFVHKETTNWMVNYWRSREGAEVGGWLIGEEETSGEHPYLRIVEVIPDSGRGTFGDFNFQGPHGALNLCEGKGSEGKKLVVIGTFHTHPPGWSGRVTVGERDEHVFAIFEDITGKLWSQKRAHIVLTPADDNKIDVWQAKNTSGLWGERLIRNGYFLLEPKTPPPSRVKIVE